LMSSNADLRHIYLFRLSISYLWVDMIMYCLCFLFFYFFLFYDTNCFCCKALCGPIPVKGAK